MELKKEAKNERGISVLTNQMQGKEIRLRDFGICTFSMADS